MFGTGYSIGVDQIMFFGLGFLICGLLAMLCVPSIHNRAVRLTEKKLDALNPIAMDDIQNEKDMMRAEFAMTARRLETSIDELKNKASAHLGDLAKKTGVIAKLKEALEQRETSIAALEQNNHKLESRVKTLFDDLQIAKADVSLKLDEVTQAERSLARAKSDVTDLRLALEEREHLIERQVVEIATLKSHADMVRSRIAEFSDAVRQSEDRLAHDRVDLMRIASPTLNSAEANGAPIALNGAKSQNGAARYPHVVANGPAPNGAGTE